jgi:hypothetical protein
MLLLALFLKQSENLKLRKQIMTHRRMQQDNVRHGVGDVMCREAAKCPLRHVIK